MCMGSGVKPSLSSRADIEYDYVVPVKLRNTILWIVCRASWELFWLIFGHCILVLYVIVGRIWLVWNLLVILELSPHGIAKRCLQAKNAYIALSMMLLMYGFKNDLISRVPSRCLTILTETLCIVGGLELVLCLLVNSITFVLHGLIAEPVSHHFTMKFSASCDRFEMIFLSTLLQNCLQMPEF